MGDRRKFLASVLVLCASLLIGQTGGAIAADVCKNGQPVPADGLCKQTCADGSQILETDTCPSATPAPAQVCKDGQPVPSDGVCKQTCADGSQISETDMCPGASPSQVCKDGRPVPADSICRQTCLDGTRIPESQSCSEPSGDQICADGRPVPADGICKKTCPGGGQVPETQSCGACPGGMVGSPPNCRCTENMTWNPRIRRCVPAGPPPQAPSPQASPLQPPAPQPPTPRAPTQQALPAGGPFGAIAFSSESGATGYSINVVSRDAAAERALQQCGSGCRLAVRFHNACGALAIGRNGWGSAWAFQRRPAEFRALELCRERTSDCKVKVLVCSGM
jgi:hypothetical protein